MTVNTDPHPHDEGMRANGRRPWTYVESMTIQEASLDYARTRRLTLISLRLRGRRHMRVTAWFHPHDLPQLFDACAVRPEGEYMGLRLLEGRRVMARFTSIVGSITGVGPVDADDGRFVATCV